MIVELLNRMGSVVIEIVEHSINDVSLSDSVGCSNCGFIMCPRTQLH